MKWLELSAEKRRETLGRFGDALLAMEVFCQAIAGSADGWGAASMKRLPEWREYLQNAVTDADRFIELGGGWKDSGALPLFRHYEKARGWVFALLDELERGAAPAALIERARNAETGCAAGQGMVAAAYGAEKWEEREVGDLIKSVLENMVTRDEWKKTDDAVMAGLTDKTRRAEVERRRMRDTRETYMMNDSDLLKIYKAIHGELKAQAERGEKQNVTKAVRVVLSRPGCARLPSQAETVRRGYNRWRKRLGHRDSCQ